MAILRGESVVVALVLGVLCSQVHCIANVKSSLTGSSHDHHQEKFKGEETWTPEYYKDRDHERYNTVGKTNFVTSFGSNENSDLSSGSQYNNRHRLSFSPFSSGSYYTPGGVYDRRPTYGLSQPIDYPSYGHQDYDGHPEYGHGYALGHAYGGKDITRSVIIPLAGAALLGIAAALVANPVLLHLGVVSGKRRRRRDVNANAHNLAYRAQLMKTKS